MATQTQARSSVLRQAAACAGAALLLMAGGLTSASAQGQGNNQNNQGQHQNGNGGGGRDHQSGRAQGNQGGDHHIAFRVGQVTKSHDQPHGGQGQNQGH